VETDAALELIVRAVTELGVIGVLLLVLKKLSNMYDVLMTLIISLIDKQDVSEKDEDETQ